MVKGGTLYYIHTDNLGSIQAITDENKTVVSSYYYTPWGARVLLSGVNITDRGYTFHEHLEPFCLINMNGRVYDPMLARFLSPDPYVQAPDYTQGFNRYSYCYNNPFKYTDPDGEWVHIVIGAVIGGVINWAAHGCQFNIDGLVAFGIGAAGGALTAATGGAALGALGTAGIFSATGVLGTGFAAGVGYTYGTAVTSLGNSIYFGDPMPTTKQFLTGLAVTVGTVGLTQGVINGLSGNNILTGEIPRVKIPKIDPLPTPEIKPIQTEEIQTTQIKSPDVTDFNYDIDNVKYTVTTESRNANISTNTSDGLSLNIERPDINGYVPQIEGKTDLFHNFPSNFDKQIVKEGVATFNNGYKDFSYTYKAAGTIVTPIKTYNGIYEIGVRIKDGFVIHKVFIPFR